MELNWKEDNNLVRKIAKILLGDTLPNGEPVSSLVLIDAASRAELQRWADMSDAEFEAARQSGDTIHIDVDDEIKRITEEYGLQRVKSTKTFWQRSRNGSSRSMTSRRNITSPIQTRISNRSPYRPTIPGTTAALTRTAISA